MEIVKKTSPYIRKETTSTKRMMIDVLIALLPVVVFAVVKFGTDALIRIIISVGVMVFLEVLSIGFIAKDKETGNFFQRFKSRYKYITAMNFLAPAVSGIIYAMLVPSQIGVYPLIVGAALGIVLGKVIFGGFGQNIFNPAAIGRIIIGLTFGSSFVYPGVREFSTGATPLGGSFTLAERLTEFDLMRLFIGDIPGAMGEICKIAILLGAAYLIVRKAADFRIMASVVATFAIMMLFAGLAIYPKDAFNFLLHGLLSGGVLFGAVFMATDPVTAPSTMPGKILYGSLIGMITALIRVFGAYPEGMAFAILISNFIAPTIDYYKWASNKYTWKFATIQGVLILGGIPLFYFASGGGF